MKPEQMAKELTALGWRVAPPLTQDNCSHENKRGRGSVSCDGSSIAEWHCTACGKTERIEIGPRDQPTMVLQN